MSIYFIKEINRHFLLSVKWYQIQRHSKPPSLIHRILINSFYHICHNSLQIFKVLLLEIYLWNTTNLDQYDYPIMDSALMQQFPKSTTWQNCAKPQSQMKKICGGMSWKTSSHPNHSVLKNKHLMHSALDLYGTFISKYANFHKALKLWWLPSISVTCTKLSKLMA